MDGRSTVAVKFLAATGAVALAVALAAAVAAPSSRPASANYVAAAATIIPRKPWPTQPAPSPTAAPILVMSVGDSLTYGADGGIYASYRQELSRLLNLAGVPHTWNVQAIGGTKCHYWATQIGQLLTSDPAIVFLNCGTNDEPTDATQADYNTILAAVAAHPNTLLVASLIGRPDPDGNANITRWPTIDDWMDGTNTKIRAALAGYPTVPVASMLRIPNNAEWLTADGIHWTPRANGAAAQLFYRAAAASRGWPSLAQLGVYEMCGLSGHDRDERWRVPDVQYRVCRSS